MKRHARIGAETLDSLLMVQPDAPYLSMAREIAATHHEKFDGTGYPLGMSGQKHPTMWSHRGIGPMSMTR